MKWRTQAGQVIDIKWMTTRHLINAYNMVQRSNPPGAIALVSKAQQMKALREEIMSRGYDPAVGQPDRDETEIELCQLRAIIDVDREGPDTTGTFWHEFRRGREYVICGRAASALFTQYRLMR